jgi:hypothetical protein
MNKKTWQTVSYSRTCDFSAAVPWNWISFEFDVFGFLGGPCAFASWRLICHPDAMPDEPAARFYFPKAATVLD